MNAAVIPFARTCPPCKEALHDRCWQHLSELPGHEHVPCPCGCHDEHGDLTHAALLDMMRRQPETLARKLRFDAAMKRSSLHLHLRTSSHKISGP